VVYFEYFFLLSFVAESANMKKKVSLIHLNVSVVENLIEKIIIVALP
jgi:hypothetical protein